MPGHPRHSLAVLPAKFVGDDSQKYLADGVVETLAAKLAGLKDVYVASVSATDPTMALKDDAKIARSLGVTLLVRTTVTISGDRISIIVAMDSAGKQGGSLLKREAGGSTREILDLENQAFIALVSALQIAQSKEELARTRKPTDAVDAYDAYLRGRTLLRGKRTAETMTKALGLFEDAIKLDPRFAPAFTGKADASLAMYNITKENTWAADALQAAQAAEGFNDSLPEVYYSLLSISAATGKFQEALAYYQHATALVPNSDEGLRRLAEAYRVAHQPEQAIARLEEATRLNKNSWRNWNQLGRLYNDSGQYDKALNAYSQVTILAPDLSTGWSNMGKIHYSQGKWSECLAEYEKAIKLEPKALYYSNRGVAYFFLGRYAESATDFEQAVKMSPKEAGYQRQPGRRLPLVQPPRPGRRRLRRGHQTGRPDPAGESQRYRRPRQPGHRLRQDRQQYDRLAVDRARSQARRQKHRSHVHRGHHSRAGRPHQGSARRPARSPAA